MNFSPKFHISPEITKHLLEIERHKEAIKYLPVTTGLISSLRETARLLSTHYSTQIEGNDLSREEVEAIAKGKELNFKGRERDEREVRNYFRALDFIEEKLEENKGFTESLIKKVHSLVLTGQKRGTPYREGQNVIKDGTSGGIVYMPPEAKDVPKLMKSMSDWINEQIETQNLPAPITAAILHYQFATIHPYYDGNGRTARLLTTFVLHKQGYGMKGIYSLEEYYAKNLSEYYNALDVGESHNYYMGREEADITPFLSYFIEGMARSFAMVRQKAELQKEREPQIQDQTELLRELRPQQKNILDLYRDYKEVNMQQIADHLGINKRNAYTLVKKWMENEFVVPTGESRKTRTYSLAKEYEQLIPMQPLEKIAKVRREQEKDRGLDLDFD